MNRKLKSRIPVNFKAFSSKRGLFFAVKGPRALPIFHTDTPPPGHPPPLVAPYWDFQLTPPPPAPCEEGRGGGVCVEFGERARPLYSEKKAPFR